MVESNRPTTVTGEWECMECGHIEEGTEALRPQKCPECNAPADALEFFAYDDEEEDWDENLEDDDEEYEEIDDLDEDSDDEDYDL